MGNCELLILWFSPHDPWVSNSRSTRQLVEMQPLDPYPRPTESETLGAGPAIFPNSFNNQMILKLENNWFQPWHRMESTNFW